MEIVLIVIGTILIVLGIVGSIVPILPGPPISYIGLLLLQFTSEPPFSLQFMIWWAIITIIVTIVDYLIPAYGTKRYGGTKSGIIGTFVGLVVGVFFVPIGLILGPIVGAFIGEIVGGTAYDRAMKPALGSFIGFLAGTGLKLITALIMAYYFFTNI